MKKAILVAMLSVGLGAGTLSGCIFVKKGDKTVRSHRGCKTRVAAAKTPACNACIHKGGKFKPKRAKGHRCVF